MVPHYRYYQSIPFTYTDFSYESLQITQIHGSFTDRYDLAIFAINLRVVTSYLRFITDYYELLRFVTVKFHNLLQVTTCLRVVKNSYKYLQFLKIFSQKITTENDVFEFAAFIPSPTYKVYVSICKVLVTIRKMLVITRNNP